MRSKIISEGSRNIAHLVIVGDAVRAEHIECPANINLLISAPVILLSQPQMIATFLKVNAIFRQDFAPVALLLSRRAKPIHLNVNLIVDSSANEKISPVTLLLPLQIKPLI